MHGTGGFSYVITMACLFYNEKSVQPVRMHLDTWLTSGKPLPVEQINYFALMDTILLTDLVYLY